MAGGEERVPHLQEHRIEEDLKPEQRLVSETPPHVSMFTRSFARSFADSYCYVFFGRENFARHLHAIGKGKEREKEREREDAVAVLCKLLLQ